MEAERLSVTPFSRLEYFWLCPKCGNEHNIGFMQSDQDNECPGCGAVVYVDSTTRADPPGNTDY